MSEHQGKVVVLDFWATWCGPCVKALPELMEATAPFDPSKVVFVAINEGETTDEIQPFIEELKWELPVGLDPQSTVGGQFEVTAIPQTVIIDPDGKIAHVKVGATEGLKDKVSDAIQALLDKRAGDPTP